MELYKVIKKGYEGHKVGDTFRANYTRNIKAAIANGILEAVSGDVVLTPNPSEVDALNKKVEELTAKVEKLEGDLKISNDAKDAALKANEELTAKVEKLEKKK